LKAALERAHKKRAAGRQEGRALCMRLALAALESSGKAKTPHCVKEGQK
jgi:hypothetical protein